MAIEVAGKRFVTLEDEFFVNGTKVLEAWANGVKVYPDGSMPSYIAVTRNPTNYGFDGQSSLMPADMAVVDPNGYVNLPVPFVNTSSVICRAKPGYEQGGRDSIFSSAVSCILLESSRPGYADALFRAFSKEPFTITQTTYYPDGTIDPRYPTVTVDAGTAQYCGETFYATSFRGAAGDSSTQNYTPAGLLNKPSYNNVGFQDGTLGLILGYIILFGTNVWLPIDYTGIEVTAFNSDGTVWTNDDYPTGIIPFNELVFPMERWDGVTTSIPVQWTYQGVTFETSFSMAVAPPANQASDDDFESSGGGDF